MTVLDPIDALRKLKTDRERLDFLHDYLRGKADRAELHRRALFATAVREAGLWPKGDGYDRVDQSSL